MAFQNCSKCISRMHRKAKRIYPRLDIAQQQRAEKKEQRDKLHDAWAVFAEKYVNEYASKDGSKKAWFATLTTQYTLTLPGARRSISRFASILRRNQKSIDGIWFGELYECKDGFHIHALIASDASRDELNEFWSLASRANRNHSNQIEKENNTTILSNVNNLRQREVVKNRSNFQSLKPGLKGGQYASKYTTKSGNKTDYDIIY